MSINAQLACLPAKAGWMALRMEFCLVCGVAKNPVQTKVSTGEVYLFEKEA